MRLLLTGLVLLSLVACRPSEFAELRDTPVISIEPPQAFRGTEFGLALTAYDGDTFDGRPASRIAATGQPGAAIAAYDVWEDDGVADFNTLWDTCDDAGECGPTQGTALVGFARWNDQTLCVMGSAPGEARLRIICESESAVALLVNVPSGESIGTSFAPIPFRHPVGVAFAGAPLMTSTGQVHRVPEGASPQPLDLSGAQLGDAARLGTHLASAELPEGTAGLSSPMLLVATAGSSRVVFAAVGEVDDEIVTSVLGCRDGNSDLFGFALAAGDLDGDEFPEVAFTERTNVVSVLDLDSLTGATGCASPDESDDPPTTHTLECVNSDRVECDGFGRSLAVGDFDADGANELAVGAPFSSVDGMRRRGAVGLFSSAGGLDPARVHYVHVANGERENLFGERVTVVRTSLNSTPRDELVTAAPGKQRVYVHLCTGLEGDRTDSTERCVEP